MFQEEQLKELYTDCRLYIYSSIFIATIIYYVNSSEMGGNKDISRWIFIIWAIAILRGIDAFLYFNAKKNSIENGFFFTRFVTGTIFAALSWCLLFWNSFLGSEIEYQAFIVFIAIAITSSATITLSYNLVILIAFQLIILLPLEVIVSIESSKFTTLLTFLIPVFFFIQVSIARHFNNKYTESIRLLINFKEKEKDYINLQYAVDQHNIVSTTDAKGNIIHVNNKFLQVSKFTRDELIGENHRIIKSNEHSFSFWKKMYQMIGKGQVSHAQIKNTAKDGSPFWMASTIVPFMNNKGIPYQYISIRTDITRLKELEQQNRTEKNDALIRAQVSKTLQGQHSLKQRITESLKIISEANGLQIQNKLGVFLLPEGANELEMFAIHGKYTKEFLHKEKCVKLGDCLCGRAAISGELLISDDCYTDPRHEHSFQEMKRHGHYIVPLSHDTKIMGILFIYTNPFPSRDQSRLDSLNYIGDLFGLAIANEQVKEELEQARKNAEDMAKTKSDFLANMSHEIRTPMNGVLGMLDLLRNCDVDKKSKEYVDIAHSSANMLLNVINDILDISKIESGKLHLESIDFDLRKSIEDTTDLLSKLAHQKNLELSCFIPPNTKTLIKGDVMRLQQVLNNLISNAIKFTTEGEVTISLSTVEESTNKIRFRFEINDTGIGIPTDKQDSLFIAFTQADSSTSRQYGGTGLGLTISKNLIEMMGGELGVISEAGQGSTFWFELPFTLISKQHTLPFSLKNLRILTIDDNDTNCMILKKYIENWGGESTTETIPESGIYRLQEAYKQNRPFDILLLDMQMPGVTGHQVAAIIRKQAIFSDLKIILLSSMGLDQNVNNQQHFDLLLNKPIKQSLLYDAIATVSKQNIITSDNTPTTKQPIVKLSGKILFVDDNIVNQQIGQAMLSTFGLDFEIVPDGKQAFDARLNNQFDLILMDCQMPVMDGFEATRQIRNFERKTKKENIPIIALTANAMQGDQEACLAAGMDDYLSKPYSTKTLFEILNHWLPDNEISIEPTVYHEELVNQSKTENLENNIIDTEKLEETREIMGNDINLIIKAFFESGQNNINEMKKHCNNDNIEGFGNATHALKGSCGVLGIQSLFDLCKKAEEKCRYGKMDDMEQHIEEISKIFDESYTVLKKYMNKKELQT